MPAKSAQKRPRESSGTPSAAVASGAQSATLTRRKRRAGSVTFEDDGSESGSTPQAKRTRGGDISGNEVDVNDVVMGEQPKGRKRGGEDRANGPSKSDGSATASASQPRSKRDRNRKSNGVASSTSTSSATATAVASFSRTGPTPATAAIAIANGLDSNPVRQEYQQQPTLAATMATAAAERAGVAPTAEGREIREGVTIEERRPPLASPGMRGKSGGRSVVASAPGRSGGPSASAGSLRKKGNSSNSTRSREQAEKQTEASVEATATVLASPVVNGSGVGAVVDSPARGVSPSRLRRIAGSEEEDSPNGMGAGAGSDLRLWPSEAEEEQGSGDFARRRGRRDWAEKILCLRLPALDDRTAMRAVQNLSLKGALLLAMLLGAWAIWTCAVFVAAGFRGVAHGRGHQEGVSRRAEAVSLFQDTEEFLSLEGVLEGRHRHLSGVRVLDQEILAAMEPLREAAMALERKMSLLRHQAMSGASSRGLPEKPEAMEEVARSQLSEVGGMAKVLNEAHHATSANVAAGQKWADDAERDLQKLLDSDRWRHDRARESEREARTAWEAEVEPRLTPAYLAIEGITSAVDAVRYKRALKPGVEDVHGYERKVQDMSKLLSSPPPQEAEAVEVASVMHQGPELKQRVETIVAREVRREWALPDKGEVARDKTGPPALKRTVDETTQLVARELEVFASGGTGMPDFAARVSGASVAEGRLGSEGENKRLTSRTLAAAVLPWGEYAAHAMGLTEVRYGGNAEDALSASNVPGDCFAFPGGGGRLTVKLAGGRWAAGNGTGAGAESGGRRPPSQGRVRVTHVSIEHAAVASVPSALGSAPRAFRVLGWDADPTASPTSSIPWGFHDTDSAGKGKGGSDAPPLRPHVLVKQAEFSVASGAPAVQTFAATAEVMEASPGEDRGRSPPPPVGWVTLEVESNHGVEWTCLYGFRVHGHRVD